jgi:trehalose/maltose transport system substrate-binding protein
MQIETKSVFNKLVAVIGLSVVLTFAFAFDAHAATVTIACGTNGADFEFCKRHTGEWAKKTGNTVKIFSQPTSTTDSLALYRQLFAAKSADVDVLMVDIVWPGIIKDHLLDLKKYSKGVESQHCREQHGRRKIARHAVVYRRRLALLPQRFAG